MTMIKKHPKAPALTLFLVLATTFLQAQPKIISANTYGAKGDGTTLNTTAIQKAIDAAAKANGTVTLKPGTYLTGSLFLKSGVTLDIPEGVTLIGSEKLEDYPELPTRIAGIEMTWPAALINARDQHNVTITGKGTIDGDGPIWWKSYWDLRATYEPKGLRWASDYDAKRPRLIALPKLLRHPPRRRHHPQTLRLLDRPGPLLPRHHHRRRHHPQQRRRQRPLHRRHRHRLLPQSSRRPRRHRRQRRRPLPQIRPRLRRPPRQPPHRKHHHPRLHHPPRRRRHHHRQRDLRRLPQHRGLQHHRALRRPLRRPLQIRSHPRRLRQRHPHPRPRPAGRRHPHPHHHELEPQLQLRHPAPRHRPQNHAALLHHHSPRPSPHPKKVFPTSPTSTSGTSKPPAPDKPST